MKQNKSKGIIACFLFLFVFLLSGCGKNEEPVENNENYAYKTEFEYFYTEDNMPYISVIGDGGTIYYACYGEGKKSRLYSLAAGAEEPKEVMLDLEPETWITSMGFDYHGDLLLTCSLYDETLKRFELIKTSKEGELLERVDLTGIFKDIPSFEADTLIGGKEGSCYIGSRKNLYEVDFSGRLIRQFEMEAAIQSLIFTKDRNGFYLLLTNGALAEMDGSQGKPAPVNSKKEFGSGIYSEGTEKDLLYSQGDSLYTGDIKEETHTELLKWTDCNISIKDLQGFRILDEGRIMAFSVRNTAGGGEGEVAVLTKIRREDMPQKKVITYGCGFLNTLTNSQIVRFNKMNAEYQIEVKQYGDDDMDMETRKGLLQRELVSGEAPDILDIGLLPMEEHYNLMEAGAFEDLSLYLDKDDRIKREDYLENILQVYEKEQKLYAIMPTFRLQGLAGKKSEMGEGEAWTVQDMIGYAGSLPEGTELIAGAGRMEILEILCQLNFQTFIDWESGECFFTGEEFTRLLEFASLLPEEAESQDWLTNMEQVRTGQAGLVEADLMSVSDFQTYEYMLKEPVSIIGYPTSTGRGIMALPCASVFAINSSSPNKEEAWEFVSYMLEENQQQELGMSGTGGIPIKRSVIDRIVKEQMEAEYEEDEEGNITEKSKFQWQNGDLLIEYYAITEQEGVLFKKLLEAAGNSMETGEERQMLEIIKEESAAFFEGDKRVEEVTEIIQNRIRTLISEKSGR